MLPNSVTEIFIELTTINIPALCYPSILFLFDYIIMFPCFIRAMWSWYTACFLPLFPLVPF
nr:MAG TPA: hypothetical protein [Caudoviricetes sp.]